MSIRLVRPILKEVEICGRAGARAVDLGGPSDQTAGGGMQSCKNWPDYAQKPLVFQKVSLLIGGLAPP